MRSAEEWNIILQRILDVGELLLINGAEVNRVEDTIRRLCQAYGFLKSDVLAITESIIVTVVLPDGLAMTQTRRIYTIVTDLWKIQKLNAFSRKICAAPVPVEEMTRMIEELKTEEKRGLLMSILPYAGISAAFTVFFGGDAMDGLASALSGIALFFFVTQSRRMRMNNLFQGLICSALTGLIVMLLVRAGIGNNPDKIMIGNIMLLIPGIQFTTSLKDVMNGDLITGSLNLFEAVMKAIAVAGGFVFVLTNMGGVL